MNVRGPHVRFYASRALLHVSEGALTGFFLSLVPALVTYAVLGEPSFAAVVLSFASVGAVGGALEIVAIFRRHPLPRSD